MREWAEGIWLVSAAALLLLFAWRFDREKKSHVFLARMILALGTLQVFGPGLNPVNAACVACLGLPGYALLRVLALPGL